MPKSAFATRPIELLEMVDDCPDLLVTYAEHANGSYAIELVDYATGESFRL